MSNTLTPQMQQPGQNSLLFDDLWNLTITSDNGTSFFLVGTITEKSAGLILTACTEVINVPEGESVLSRAAFNFNFISVPIDYEGGNYAALLNVTYNTNSLSEPVSKGVPEGVPEGAYKLNLEIWIPGDEDISPHPCGHTTVDWVISDPKGGTSEGLPDISPAPQSTTSWD